MKTQAIKNNITFIPCIDSITMIDNFTGEEKIIKIIFDPFTVFDLSGSAIKTNKGTARGFFDALTAPDGFGDYIAACIRAYYFD